MSFSLHVVSLQSHRRFKILPCNEFTVSCCTFFFNLRSGSKYKIYNTTSFKSLLKKKNESINSSLNFILFYNERKKFCGNKIKSKQFSVCLTWKSTVLKKFSNNYYIVFSIPFTCLFFQKLYWGLLFPSWGLSECKMKNKYWLWPLHVSLVTWFFICAKM